MAEGEPVEFFEPTCIRCGRTDDGPARIAWFIIGPDSEPVTQRGVEPGVYCGACQTALGLLADLEGRELHTDISILMPEEDDIPDA